MTKHMFVVTKHVSCHDKHNFVATKNCCDKPVFASKAHFCRDKRHVLLWQTCVCHDKHVFVVTEFFSRQKWYLWQLSPMILDYYYSWQSTLLFPLRYCSYPWHLWLSTPSSRGRKSTALIIMIALHSAPCHLGEEVRNRTKHVGAVCMAIIFMTAWHNHNYIHS